ncbi:MAG TPA: CNNM domain-containing protein, partial [Vicinamibacteria bacterium]
MTEQTFLVAAIILCLLGNGFFSGSEIAIISARRSQVEALLAAGSRRARSLKRLQENLDDFLATVQIGVTLMGTLAGVLGGYLAKGFVEPWVAKLGLPHWISPTFAATLVIGGGIVYFELIFGELVPKALA